MDFNPQLRLALNFVQYTGRHVFLTGKAGTGKTTFLHYLRQNSPKRMIVVAPTGVAAINAGGVTIHSFFQLPFGPNVPGFNDSGTQGFKRFSAEKRNIIRSLDLLVIDEISMVRADLLDGIDQTLRRFRPSSKPFGGVQLLMIGDMQQLAPVIKEEEWRLINTYYASPFFFSSKALQKTDYVTIELQQVYRQTDRNFIDLLNKIRDNKVDKTVSDELNSRYNPDVKPGDDGYILLTTHNARAKAVNEARLKELAGSKMEYRADIEDNFPEHMYPTEPVLSLKKYAQVMFIKNDPDPEKRFFNGKIGTITDLNEDYILVQCEGEEHPITVVPIEWQHMKYSLDSESKEITESIEGRFVQIPLKLAWAITIHKSQGLTFEKAIIDAQQAFAYGQVYVALSRCRSLEGLVLSTPFSRNTLITDRTIDSFNEQVTSNQPDEEGLAQSKNKYRQDLLLQLFDFGQLQKAYYRLIKILKENKGSLQPGIADEVEHNLRIG
ncbi:MAG: AAA family ATPase [bacterium]